MTNVSHQNPAFQDVLATHSPAVENRSCRSFSHQKRSHKTIWPDLIFDQVCSAPICPSLLWVWTYCAIILYITHILTSKHKMEGGPPMQKCEFWASWAHHQIVSWNSNSAASTTQMKGKILYPHPLHHVSSSLKIYNVEQPTYNHLQRPCWSPFSEGHHFPLSLDNHLGTLTIRLQPFFGMEVTFQHPLIEQHVTHWFRNNHVNILR